MVKASEVLAIIPARGGSKGIPGKNIRSFGGYPLIAFSIAAAKQSATVTRVIVSTDDKKIAEAARTFGAEVPFMRPAELAQDDTTDLPVFEHALRWLAENEGYHPDLVIQLRPTSPVRPRNCVDEAVALLNAHPEADSVRGVVPSGQNPYKMWHVEEKSGKMQPLMTLDGVREPYNAPRQSLPPTFWQTGHIDVIRPTAILEQHSMSGACILGFKIDPRFTVDLDKPSDWDAAEKLLFSLGGEVVWPGKARRSLPEKVELLVLDFDGVLTDNRVWVDEHGLERVAANRGDSYGLKLLRMKKNIPALVLSTEKNKVVAARCRKMEIESIQGVWDKAPALLELLKERGIDPAHVVYVGNDLNDLPCFPIVGFAAAPADAQPEVKQEADLVLSMRGGRGAVREMCDLLMEHLR